MKIKSYSIRIEQDLLHKLHYMAAYDGRSAYTNYIIWLHMMEDLQIVKFCIILNKR